MFLFISLSITFLISYSLLTICLLIFSFVNCLPIFIVSWQVARFLVYSVGGSLPLSPVSIKGITYHIETEFDLFRHSEKL